MCRRVAPDTVSISAYSAATHAQHAICLYRYSNGVRHEPDPGPDPRAECVLLRAWERTAAQAKAVPGAMLQVLVVSKSDHEDVHMATSKENCFLRYACTCTCTYMHDKLACLLDLTPYLHVPWLHRLT